MECARLCTPLGPYPLSHFMDGHAASFYILLRSDPMLDGSMAFRMRSACRNKRMPGVKFGLSLTIDQFIYLFNVAKMKIDEETWLSKEVSQTDQKSSVSQIGPRSLDVQRWSTWSHRQSES